MTTEIQAPRDTQGQFVPAEDTFGIKGVEIAQGYVPRPDAPTADTDPDDAPWEHSSDEEAIRALAKKKYGEAPPDLVEIKLTDADGNPAPDNLSQTVEQAYGDLTAATAVVAADVEAREQAEFAAEVDKARLEAFNHDPNVAKYYGIELPDALANAEESKAQLAEKAPAEAKPAADQPAEIEGQPSATSEVEGLSPDVARALEHPQIREAVEQEFARADTARQQYEAAVNTANHFAQQALADHLPELASIPIEQWEAAITILHQQNPERVTNALGVLQRYAHTSQAQQQLQQQRTLEQHQQIETWARSQDARLKDFGVELNAQVTSDVVDYAKDELGIERDHLARIIQANPILRSAEFTRVITDAAKFRALKAAPAKAAPKGIPAVLKPGIGHSKADRAAADLGSLRAKLHASGSVEDAYALYQAKTKSRSR